MDTEKLNGLDKILPRAVSFPGEESYEEASQFFKRTLAPSVVARPASSKEMAIAIQFFNEHTLPIVIKSGGHSNIVYNIPDGSALVDLSALNTVEVVDREKGIVRVGSGALAGEIADALDKYGLALASGDSRVVGIGGLATGGGLGFLVRKYGAIVDDLISAEVVTADGTIIEASEDEHTDLFWAIRGGGSNFGIVTHFTVQAHPVTQVYEATLRYPLKNVATILKGWRDIMRKAPVELSTILTILPPKAETPASIVIHGCFSTADKLAAEKAYAPLLSLDEPLHYSMEAKPYKDVLESGPPRFTDQRSIARNVFLKTFNDEAIEAIARLCETGTPPILQIRHVAGAMNERPAEMTAFSHRDSEVLLYHGTSVTFDATDREINTALAAWQTIEPLGTGCYINMSSDASEAEIAKAFPFEVLQRLQRIKKRYDPNNVFHLNYNIHPKAS